MSGDRQFTEFQLEERVVAPRSWRRVVQTDDEASGGENAYVSFTTKEAAKKYANEDTQRWAPKALDRGVVRILKVSVILTVLD